MQIEFPTEKTKQPKFDWKKVVKENRLSILSFSALIMASGFFLAKLSMGETNHLKDYFQSNFQLGRLHRNEEPNEAIMAKLVNKHPELIPAFSQAFTSLYRQQDDKEAAILTARESLNRLHFLNNPYIAFSNISLVIEGGMYEEALEKAELFQVKLDKKSYPKLDLFNQLRIGFLNMTLGNKDLGRAQILSVKNLLTKEEGAEITPQLKAELISHLSSDQVSLFDLADG